MATITDSRLAKQVRERIRPRAEQILGMRTQLLDDIEVITPFLPSDDAIVIDDGQPGPLDFRNSDFNRYVELVSGLQLLYTGISEVIDKLKVRALGNIVRPYTPSDAIVSDAASALRYRIRAMAPHIQKIRYQFEQDVAIVGEQIVGLTLTDIIDEERTDGVEPVTVGDVSALIGWAGQIIDPSVITTERARAVNAASLQPVFG